MCAAGQETRLLFVGMYMQMNTYLNCNMQKKWAHVLIHDKSSVLKNADNNNTSRRRQGSVDICPDMCTLHSSSPGGSLPFRSSFSFEPPLTRPSTTAGEAFRKKRVLAALRGDFCARTKKFLICLENKRIHLLTACSTAKIVINIWRHLDNKAIWSVIRAEWLFICVVNCGLQWTIVCFALSWLGF